MNVLTYIAFNFIIYSFSGWIIEEIYSFIITGKFKKEGFLIGPFKPMYGIAFTLLIFYNEILKIDGIPLMLICFLIPTTVEYISGYMLKHIFNKIYWDYSNLKYNINGLVNLKFSLYWVVLSIIGIYYFHPIIRNIYIVTSAFSIIAVYVFLTIFIIDLILTLQNLKGNIFLKKQIKD